MIKLHNDANARTVALARILVFSTWMAWFLTDNSYLIANIEFELFHKLGILKLLSDNFFRALTPTAILVIKGIIVYTLFTTIIGGPKAKWHMFISLVLITFYMGYIRGFGGHSNHREMTLLYCSYVMLLLPCYDALSLYHNSNGSLRPKGIYQASMVAICLIILFQYSVIGIARLSLGFPESFHPDVMYRLIINRSMRPNNFGIELGLYLLEYPWLKYFTAPFLPFSTILEIISPIVLFAQKRVRLFFVIMLAAFHLGIFLFMNILFIENIMLLLLLVNYTKFFNSKSCAKKDQTLYLDTNSPMLYYLSKLLADNGLAVINIKDESTDEIIKNRNEKVILKGSDQSEFVGTRALVKALSYHDRKFKLMSIVLPIFVWSVLFKLCTKFESNIFSTEALWLLLLI